MKRCGFALFLFVFHARALVFPLQPDSDGRYDVTRNTLSSFEQLWQTNHHAVLNFHGASGVAIAPRWVATAGHLAAGKTTNNWFNDDSTRYFIQEIHPLDGDLALVKVDRPLPHYSELAKTAARQGAIVTVYGQGAAAKDPVLDSLLTVRGWQLAPLDYYPVLRWGRGRLLADGSPKIDWLFTAADPDLGLDCAGTGTNDSGGGIFTGEKLNGIVNNGAWIHVRTNQTEPLLCDPARTDKIGQIFDGSTLFNCYDNNHPRSISSGESLSYQLADVFSLISPPLRLYSGASSITLNGRTWEPIQCDGCALLSEDSGTSIDTSEIADPPPPEIYKTARVIRNGAAQAMVFRFSDLVKYEHYNVRLHFSATGPCSAPGVCRESIRANTRSVLFDPFIAPGKASEFEFHEVSPDENSQIELEIRAANPDGTIFINAIELELVPSWLQPPPKFKWNSITTLAPATKPAALAFGRGRFVCFTANGAYYSDDLGLTWLPCDDFIPASDVVFAQGNFVATGRSGILYSADGTHWTRVESPPNWFGDRVLFGNNTFFIPGNFGLSAHSASGLNWQFEKSSASVDSSALTFGNGRFVTLELFAQVWFSSDARNWDPAPAQFPASGFSQNLGYGDGIFMTQPFGFSHMLISTNAVTWTDPSGTLPPVGSLTGPQMPRSFHGVFVAVPQGMITTNFAEWQNLSVLPPKYAGQAVAFGDDTFVFAACDRASGPALIARGPSLTSLEPVNQPFVSPAISDAAIRGSNIVLLSSSPQFAKTIFYSAGLGQTFHQLHPPQAVGPLASVAASADRFVVAAAGGSLLESVNGGDWTTVDTGTSLTRVRYLNGIWIACGANGTMLTSSDGVNFQLAATGTTSTVRDVAFGRGQFFAAGDNGTILFSRDAVNWAVQHAGTNSFSSVAFGNGVFAANAGDRVFLSEDGVAWRELDWLPVVGLKSLTWADGVFFAATGTASAYISTDGVLWSQIVLPGIAAGARNQNGTIWAYGDDGFFGSLHFDNSQRPVLAASRAPDDSLTLSISVPHRGNYEILSSTGGPFSWQKLTVLSNIASTAIWTDPHPVEAMRFYQVRQEE